MLLKDIGPPPWWLLATQALELVIIGLSLFLAKLASRTMGRHRLFHWNLRLIMRIMSTGWVIMTGARMASLIQQFVEPDAIVTHYILLTRWPYVILEVVRISGCALIVSGAMAGIVERICASIMLETYEKSRHTCLVLLGVACCFPLTGLMAYYSFSPRYGYLVAIFAGILSITIFAAFVCVDRWNKRRLALVLRLALNYSLNERYQLSENIRAASLVFRASIFGTCGAAPIVSFILLYTLVDTQTQAYAVRAAFNLYSTLYSTALLLILITRPHAWRKDFFRQLRNLRPLCLRTNRVIVLDGKKWMEERRDRVQNLDGVQLEFSQDEERRRYFDQLDSAWNR